MNDAREEIDRALQGTDCRHCGWDGTKGEVGKSVCDRLKVGAILLSVNGIEDEKSEQF